jgi:hypothetical protein
MTTADSRQGTVVPDTRQQTDRDVENPVSKQDREPTSNIQIQTKLEHKTADNGEGEEGGGKRFF